MFARREMSFTLSYSPSLGAPEKMHQDMLHHQVVPCFHVRFPLLLKVTECDEENLIPPCTAQFEEG